jgi:two-component system chemotaxis response regulator CheY
MVVDDSATMRALYKQTLARVAKTSLAFACDGQDALERIPSFEPHVVVLDVNMPRMNGLELLGELRRLGLLETVRVVLVSTEGTDADVQRGLAAGASEYVKKPFKMAQISSVIERLAPVSEGVTVRCGPAAQQGGE